MKKTSLLLLFLGCILSISAQIKSGLILSVGKGTTHNIKYYPSPIESEMSRQLDYKFDVTIGYKFRIQPQVKPYFYDIDVSLGLKQLNYAEYADDNHMPPPFRSINNSYFNLSLAPSWNYSLIKGLYLGGGIEPTLYYISGDDSEYKFDLPIAMRVGYCIKFIDIAFSYKLGLFNTMDSHYMTSGRFNNWQIQLFVPF